MQNCLNYQMLIDGIWCGARCGFQAMFDYTRPKTV